MHEIEWQVEGGNGKHTAPAGAEIVFWLDKAEKRNVSVKYISDPYYNEEDPIVEVLLPDGKRVVVSKTNVTINQD